MSRTPFLPDEILLCILQSVPTAADLVAPENFEEYKLTVKTLANICMTSKRLCAFAQPLLYRTFVKDKTKYEEWEDEEGRRVNVDLDVRELFIETLTEQEEQGDYSDSDSEEGSWEREYRTEQRDERLRRELYRKVAVERERDLLRFAGKPRRPTRLQMFLRTLVMPPDLAARVEGLRLTEFQRVFDRKEEQRRPIDPALVELFEKASDGDLNLSSQMGEVHSPPRPELRDLEEDDRQVEEGEGEKEEDDYEDDDDEDDAVFQSEFKYGSENAEVTLLLNLVPKLRSLDMATRREDFGDYSHDFLDGKFGGSLTDGSVPVGTFTGPTSQSSSTPALFTNLQSLSLRANDDPEAPWPAKLELKSCIELLKLPTLTSLSIYGAKDESMSPRITRLSLNHIRHLHLNDCSFSSEVVGRLIESCRRLQTLDIRFESHAINEIEDEFYDCLDKRADTLTSLTLTMPHGKCQVTSESRFDLSKFYKLKYLEICQHPLIPTLMSDCELDFEIMADLLPVSLEELRVRRVDKEILVHLKHMLDEFAFDPFHNLKAFEIELETPLDGKRPASEVVALSSILGDCTKVMEDRVTDFKVSVRQEKDIRLMF